MCRWHCYTAETLLWQLAKQDTEGGGGEGVSGRGGAVTKASSTLPLRPAGVGEGAVVELGAGTGTATTVAEGLVGIMGAGAGERMPGEGPEVGGKTGAGAGAAGALHDFEAPAGSLQVCVH